MSIQTEQMEQETTWTFPVAPQVHVTDPYIGRQQTWSLIRSVKVTLSIYPSGERRWDTNAYGVPAMKDGGQRGSSTSVVYGEEADALCVEANLAVKDRQQGIVIRGNPVDGLTYEGPFDSTADAIAHIESFGRADADWWVAPLSAPEVA